MKLAEALQLRSDLQKRMEQLSARLNNNALVQEGDKPAEDPQELLVQLEQVSNQLARIITQINLTNSATKTDAVTLTQLLARRDVATRKLEMVRKFLRSASEKTYRSRGSEIKILSTVNVRELQKQVDAESKALRELESQIQGLNWMTELQE